MFKFKSFLSLLCAASVIIGAPSAVFAGDGASTQSVAEIDKQIADIQNQINIAQKEVDNTNAMLRKNEEEINVILQSSDEPNSINKSTECEEILRKKTKELSYLRENLDQATSEIISLEGSVPSELKLKKDEIEAQYNAMLDQVNELNSQIEKLRLDENEINNRETKLKNLLEEQAKYDDSIKKSNETIKNLQIKINNLNSDKSEIENKIRNNEKKFNDWNKYLSGNQFEDNMLNGEREAGACWLFSATNVINYFNCILGNGAPIQGFKNVVNSYFQKCGNRALVGYVEYIIEYLKKFDISTYNLSFENNIKNLNNLTNERKEQINNIKEFVVKYFTMSRNPAPILNLNSEHWLTFAAYDDIENKLLVIDSATGKVEWKSLDSVMDSATNIRENRIIWQLLFSFKNKQSDGDYFSEDWDMPLTETAKKDVLSKICEF